MGIEWLLPSPLDFLARRWRATRRQKRLRQARSWPKAHGIIIGGHAKRAQDPEGRFAGWNPELIYSYVVNGDYYSGRDLLPPETEGEVQEQLRAWKERKIIVRYCPLEPTRSALLAEDQPSS